MFLSVSFICLFIPEFLTITADYKLPTEVLLTAIFSSASSVLIAQTPPFPLSVLPNLV